MRSSNHQIVLHASGILCAAMLIYVRTRTTEAHAPFQPAEPPSVRSLPPSLHSSLLASTRHDKAQHSVSLLLIGEHKDQPRVALALRNP